MRLPLFAICTALLSLAFAGSASAHQPLDAADFSFVATIDCGSGPVEVGSTDDIYAPLIDLETGRRYEPVAWDVSFGDFHFVDTKEGVTRRNSVECSYVDEWVSGTVTVKRTGRFVHGGHHGHHGHHGIRFQDRWGQGSHGRH
jgi:hypothetical protein